MRAPWLDLARPYRPFPWGGVLLLLTVGLLALWGWQRYALLEARRALLDSQVEQLNLQRRTQSRASQATEQVAKINGELEAQLRLQQDEIEPLLHAVELAWQDNIALTSLQLARKQGIMRIELEAKNYETIADFANRLAKQAGMFSVRVERHLILTDNPQRPTRVRLLVQWRAQP